MNVLFIGGIDVISLACSQLVIQRGYNLTVLTTRTKNSSLNSNVNYLLKNKYWDCIVDFISYTPQLIESTISIFRRRSKQYIFISSALIYKKPPSTLPVVESNCFFNPFLKYSKIK